MPPATPQRSPCSRTLPGSNSPENPSETFLEAVYYDTARLELAARGIALRRRTGGADQGWHLKLPTGPDSRREVQAPLGQPDRVPAELLDQLAAFTRGHNLSPVARLSTRRSTYQLHGAGREHLADFTDDRVHAVILRGLGPEKHWREWELELFNATSEFFTAAQPALEAAGAVPSAHTSKLARALGPSLPEAAAAEPGPARKNGPVRDVVTAYVSVQINKLLAHDAGVRQGVPDSVHQMRSAARRTRSVLRTYRTLFTKGALVELERDLQWLGRILSRPHDAEEMSGQDPRDPARPARSTGLRARSWTARTRTRHRLQHRLSARSRNAQLASVLPDPDRPGTLPRQPAREIQGLQAGPQNQRTAGEQSRSPSGPRPPCRQKSSRNRRIRHRAPSGPQRRHTTASRRRISHRRPREAGTCPGKNRPPDPRRPRRPPGHRRRPRTPTPARHGTRRAYGHGRCLYGPDQNRKPKPPLKPRQPTGNCARRPAAVGWDANFSTGLKNDVFLAA